MFKTPYRMLVNTLVLSAVCVIVAGCGTIYSRQTYGSPAQQRVSTGAVKAEVFANLGEPNAIYRDPSHEVFVYKFAQGFNVLGLYAKIRRSDTVVVMDAEGTVQWVGEVPVGNGMTILAPPMLDMTHPVHTGTLLFEPENYKMSTEVESGEEAAE